MRTIASIIGIACAISLSLMGQTKETVKIAAIGSKTGDAAQSYRTFFPAVRFAVDEINQQGGLLGKQVEVLEFDNEGTPLGSKLAAEKAVAAKVIGVIGAFWSSHSLAMAPVLQEAHIPMISPLSTNPQVTLSGDYIFRVCFLDSFQGVVVANFAFQDLHAKTAIVVTQKSDLYSQELGTTFIKSFRQSGGKILHEGSYLQGATSFSEIIEQIVRLRPDVVFVPGYARESAFLIRHTRNRAVSTPFLGGDGWGVEMIEYGGETVNGNYYCHHWQKDSTLLKSKQFVEKFLQSRFSKQIEINAGLPLTYDAVQLLGDAAKRANSLDPMRIRDALAATKGFQCTTGQITFDQNIDPVNKAAVILQFDHGKIVFVKSIEP